MIGYRSKAKGLLHEIDANMAKYKLPSGWEVEGMMNVASFYPFLSNFSDFCITCVSIKVFS